MFTGLIEEQGVIKSLTHEGSNLHIEIKANVVLEDVALGDSIAVDGACQTVVKITDDSFVVTAIDETLKLTNFNAFVIGTKVNLERCLKPSDRLGGHIVQGHVDALAELKSVTDEDGSYVLEFKIPQQLSKYIIYKGSIAVNGISLTVAAVNDDSFKVCIIPKTWEMTNLADLKLGDQVNIEPDQIAKYVESLLDYNGCVVKRNTQSEGLNI